MSMRNAKFYDPHRGIAGPGVPLHPLASAVAEAWDGTEGDPEDFASELRDACPDSEVEVCLPEVDPLEGPSSKVGMVTLRIPAEGMPAHCWRVIRFE